MFQRFYTLKDVIWSLSTLDHLCWLGGLVACIHLQQTPLDFVIIPAHIDTKVRRSAPNQITYVTRAPPMQSRVCSRRYPAARPVTDQQSQSRGHATIAHFGKLKAMLYVKEFSDIAPKYGGGGHKTVFVTSSIIICSQRCVWQLLVMANWLTTSMKSSSKPAMSSLSWHGTINPSLTARVSLRLLRITPFHRWEPRWPIVRCWYRPFRTFPPPIPMSTALSSWPASRAQSAHVFFPPSLPPISRLTRTSLASTTPHTSPSVRCSEAKRILSGPWFVSAGSQTISCRLRIGTLKTLASVILSTGWVTRLWSRGQGMSRWISRGPEMLSEG